MRIVTVGVYLSPGSTCSFTMECAGYFRGAVVTANTSGVAARVMARTRVFGLPDEVQEIKPGELVRPGDELSLTTERVEDDG